MFKRDKKLPSILSAPTLSPSDKSQIVAELAKLTGTADRGDTVRNFLRTLAENNRLGLLEGVCEKFATLIGVHRGEIELEVTSAAVGFLFSDLLIDLELGGLRLAVLDYEGSTC